MLYPAELRARAPESTTRGGPDGPAGWFGQSSLLPAGPDGRAVRRRDAGSTRPRDGCKRTTVFEPGVNREPT